MSLGQAPDPKTKEAVFTLIYDVEKATTRSRIQGDFPIAPLINGLWMALLLYGQQQIAAAVGLAQQEGQKRLMAPDGRPLPNLKH